MSNAAPRRKDSLSKRVIIDKAIIILDRDGEDGLTFRALAQELSTGAGALYYHVANKEELLSEATNSIVSEYLLKYARSTNPLDNIRNVALSLWEATETHPWVGTYIPSEPSRISVAKIYEAIGGQLGALHVPERDQFDVGSAIGGYVVGSLNQQSANARRAKVLATQGYTRESYLKEFTQNWQRLDPQYYPFIHKIMDEFPTHDDRAQYLAGVELLLSGIQRRYTIDAQYDS